MPRLSFIIGLSRLDPANEEAQQWCAKHRGKTVSADVRIQRSPEHNRLFWAVANKTFANLPEKYAHWHDPHDMVKGLQLAFGITEPLLKPTKDGREVVEVPKSLDFGNMDQTTFNTVSEALFKGMAHMLSVSVDELIEEGRIAA